MKKKFSKSDLDTIVTNISKNKLIYGAVFYVSSDDGSIDYISASGNMHENRHYYIASINKLIISALILRLYSEKKLGLHDKIARYLSTENLDGLHTYKDTDYSRDIEIIHLLSHTSGLPDYLEDKQPNGRIAMKDLEAGIDQSWPISKVLVEVKKMQPHFPPGQKGKARYIDTNHHLLGLIIEQITGIPMERALENMFHELDLTDTYVFTGEQNQDFAPIYYKSEIRDISLFVASTKYDIVSTARNQMMFLKAFFNGHFFPKHRLEELERWNRIFFPFKYGIGIQKFEIPRIFTLLKTFPKMIGHGGSTGSVAFYVPERNLYITGTVNQQAAPRLAYQAMMKIINDVVK